MFTPKYTISPEVLSAIAEIAEIKVIVERSRVLPLNELELKRQALIRMVHTSTSIEGNKLKEYQVDKVLSGLTTNNDDKSIIEVKNYQNAVKEIEKLAQDQKTLSIDLILKLHQTTMKDLLPSEKVGHFRKGDIYIVDDLGDGKEQLRFRGPDAQKVPYLIDELLQWLRKKDKEMLHPIIKAGIFHTQFVHIHPFTDGNGRVTRLLTIMLLYLSGWDFRKVIVLEEFYNKSRQDYYNALSYGWKEKYHIGAEFTPWLEYFVAGFLVEARKVKDVITSLGFDKVDAKSQMFLDPDEIKIIDMTVATFRITSDDVVKLLNIAKRTAQLKLKNLVEKGLIKTEGKARATYYIPAQ